MATKAPSKSRANFYEISIMEPVREVYLRLKKWIITKLVELPEIQLLPLDFTSGHIINYALGYYKKKDVIKDLQVIVGEGRYLKKRECKQVGSYDIYKKVVYVLDTCLRDPRLDLWPRFLAYKLFIPNTKDWVNLSGFENWTISPKQTLLKMLDYIKLYAKFPGDRIPLPNKTVLPLSRKGERKISRG